MQPFFLPAATRGIFKTKGNRVKEVTLWLHGNRATCQGLLQALNRDEELSDDVNDPVWAKVAGCVL